MSANQMRADQFLVERGLAPSRNRAQELIEKGRVFIVNGKNRKMVSKASIKVGPGDDLLVEDDRDADTFVSRGGTKLKGALARTKLDVKDKRALDIGISTGGFTDCLLQAGASFVVGVDVGHSQLAQKLARDRRLKLIEGVNARDLSAAQLLAHNGGNKFDLAVIDVSFISLTLVLPEVIQYLSEAGALLALVKPQFEVGREGLGKNGIVKDASLFTGVEEKIRACVTRSGFLVEDYFESSIAGSDGNREFFVFARQAQLELGGFSFDRGGSGGSSRTSGM